jgi:hypothetical protein
MKLEFHYIVDGLNAVADVMWIESRVGKIQKGREIASSVEGRGEGLYTTKTIIPAGKLHVDWSNVRLEEATEPVGQPSRLVDSLNFGAGRRWHTGERGSYRGLDF